MINDKFRSVHCMLLLTVVPRQAERLETLINRGEHVGTDVALHVDDQRVNFNFIEELQGRVVVGVSSPEIDSFGRLEYRETAILFHRASKKCQIIDHIMIHNAMVQQDKLY